MSEMSDIQLRNITRLRAIPVAEGGREVGTRYEVETAAGNVLVVPHTRHFELWRSLLAAGARLRHLNLGLEMRCRGTEVAVDWPEEITNGEGEAEAITNEEATPRPATLDDALAGMVAKGTAARPTLAGRLDSAAQLVRDGLVHLAGDTARIGPYTITAETCACRDFEYRGGWCKHRLAVRMARHLTAHGFALPAPQPAAPAPQISARNRALIAGGTVIDKAQREEAAFRRSGFMEAMMDATNLALVEAAFDTLLEVVGRECDYRTVDAVHAAKVDVMAILSGEWPAQAAAAELEDEEPADAPRCPACNQSLGEIGRSGFACPTCYETFGAEAIEARLPF